MSLGIAITNGEWGLLASDYRSGRYDDNGKYGELRDDSPKLCRVTPDLGFVVLGEQALSECVKRSVGEWLHRQKPERGKLFGELVDFLGKTFEGAYVAFPELASFEAKPGLPCKLGIILLGRDDASGRILLFWWETREKGGVELRPLKQQDPYEVSKAVQGFKTAEVQERLHEMFTRYAEAGFFDAPSMDMLSLGVQRIFEETAAVHPEISSRCDILVIGGNRDDLKARSCIRPDGSYATDKYHISAFRQFTDVSEIGTQSSPLNLTVYTLRTVTNIHFPPGWTQYKGALSLVVGPGAATFWTVDAWITVGGIDSGHISVSNPSTSGGSTVTVSGLTPDTDVSLAVKAEVMLSDDVLAAITATFNRRTDMPQDTVNFV